MTTGQHTAAEKVVVPNPLGMHARAATKFVALANQFECDVAVTKGRDTVNGKSIMGVLMLVAAQHSVITIEGRGADADAAVAALANLVRDGFGEMQSPEHA